ncbi:MAG: alkaline phosphatase family protein [Bacteriovoracia bacterium]
MKKTHFFAFTFAGLLISTALGLSCATTPKSNPSNGRPDHLVFLVFDAMRPDYIDRFEMKNFQKLRAQSRAYTQARLGYLGAETVVTHSVLGTGLPPRDLPWQDNDYFDRDGKLGVPGKFYSLTDVGLPEFTRLQSEIPRERFLVHALKEKFDRKVFSAGSKGYAAMIFGTPHADAIVTMKKVGERCVPAGRNVPSYISQAPRFEVDCSQAYGTESTYYPIDGAHYVPGADAQHAGGDVWTADVAEQIIRREEWSGLFLTFGGIDKVAHMLGEQDGKRPEPALAVETEYDLRKVCEIADAQLGRVLATIEDAGLKDRTLVVVTADHGGQSNYHYLGVGRSAKVGRAESAASSKWVQSYAKLPEVQYTFQDSAVRLWLKEPKATEEYKSVVTAMSKVPGMVEVYRKHRGDPGEGGGWTYRKVFSRLRTQPKKFRRWAESNYSDMLHQYASENGPDLVGLTADNTGFDLLGDHGGLQENVQRVPLFIRVPGEAPSSPSTPIRSFEIKAQIVEAMGF